MNPSTADLDYFLAARVIDRMRPTTEREGGAEDFITLPEESRRGIAAKGENMSIKQAIEAAERATPRDIDWTLGGCSGRMITTPSGYYGDGFLGDFDTLQNATIAVAAPAALAWIKKALPWVRAELEDAIQLRDTAEKHAGHPIEDYHIIVDELTALIAEATE